MADRERAIAGIGALVEPIRRRLYRYVSTQPRAVSRDEAAAAVDVPRHQAKFHLDRLEAEGLLAAEYRRVGGRSGPGAGRPAKHYRRADGEISVSLPQREYELAATMLADAISEAADTGGALAEVVRDVAAARGRALAEEFGEVAGEQTLEAAAALVERFGYEPVRDGDAVVMANCPFHSLARSHADLVCAMNEALLEALVDGVAPERLRARLDPAEGRCCVVLTERKLDD